MNSFCFSLLILLLLAGCGYHFEEVESQEGVVTISVPYIKGDPEGKFNCELVRALSSTGQFDCMQNGGGLILEASITAESDDRIGYRFDRNATTGKLRDNIVGTENRHHITAVVSLLSAYTREVVIGPQTITAFADYDYVDSNSIRDLTLITTQGSSQRVLDFSLGQLDSVSGAHDDTAVVIYRILAQKIVDGLVVMKACELAEEEEVKP